MAKKLYIPVSSNSKNYKLYMDDIKKIHSIAKPRRPPVPAFNYGESPIKFEANDRCIVLATLLVVS